MGAFIRERERLMQKVNITFFYHDLGTEYFIIKQVFQKKQHLWKKLRKTICGST